MLVLGMGRGLSGVWNRVRLHVCLVHGKETVGPGHVLGNGVRGHACVSKWGDSMHACHACGLTEE